MTFDGCYAKMLPRCRYRRASGLLSVAFFVFIVFQIIVLNSQKTVQTVESSSDIKEGRRLFGENTQDDQISSLFSHPADSTVLVSYVYKMIKLPSGADYNLTYPHLQDFARGQCQIIDEYLNKTENGYFVEIGVLDGERHSVSLFFERERNWNGLVIEPHPEHYNQLLHKNRKSSTLQACVKTNHTETKKEYKISDQHYFIPCLWMETILMASGHRNIDLLAINVKSKEYDILQSIPFDKFDIKTLSIEFTKGSDSEMDIIKYLTSQGFRAQHEFANHLVKKSDLVFVKN
ncbi:hypothetical protein KUTeg_012356 [Tegillarca granosa]|uniref:Methyltransferase FkbM domain-containing protein n=1 Tax=Tegillarca granosa TaxID=220873 RepID=A0ABQ9EZA4_TEGGR|nr:hypothetical protein KUTeg_012356 [Tegillarca granosa]